MFALPLLFLGLIFAGVGVEGHDPVFLALAAALIGLAFGQLDPDTGGYADSFLSPTGHVAPDKLWHFGLALAIACVAALLVGLAPARAILLTILGGIAYEVGQGTRSWRDVVADAVGAVLGGALAAVVIAWRA